MPQDLTQVRLRLSRVCSEKKMITKPRLCFNIPVLLIKVFKFKIKFLLAVNLDNWLMIQPWIMSMFKKQKVKIYLKKVAGLYSHHKNQDVLKLMRTKLTKISKFKTKTEDPWMVVKVKRILCSLTERSYQPKAMKTSA